MRRGRHRTPVHISEGGGAGGRVCGVASVAPSGGVWSRLPCTRLWHDVWQQRLWRPDAHLRHEYAGRFGILAGAVVALAGAVPIWYRALARTEAWGCCSARLADCSASTGSWRGDGVVRCVRRTGCEYSEHSRTQPSASPLECYF